MTSLTGRRAARALALQVLYAADGDGAADVDGAVASWPADFELELEQVLDDDGRALAHRLAQAAVDSGAAIDQKIAAASRNWRLERMGRVDRNLLRLAVGELVTSPETPVRVVINEAVELAKRFGTADSPAFVNGLLDRIAGGLGRAPVAAGAAEPATAGVEAAAGAEPVTAASAADPVAADGVDEAAG